MLLFGMLAAGFVLVGGLSTRMGRDKALLPADSQPLVTAVAQHVARAAGSVALVGKPERYRSLGFSCIADLRPDSGPLAGIEAALVSDRGDLNLIVACDMPNLNARFLQALLRHAQETSALCVVSRDPTGIHPLCAVYRRDCLGLAQRALDARRLSLMDLIAEMRAIPFDADGVLWNVNTPHEWSAWREQGVSQESPLTPLNGN